jgi:hypothetical protein
MTANADTLSVLEANALDIPEECPVCADGTDFCPEHDDQDEADSWELAVKEERERLE